MSPFAAFENAERISGVALDVALPLEKSCAATVSDGDTSGQGDSERDSEKELVFGVVESPVGPILL